MAPFEKQSMALLTARRVRRASVSRGAGTCGASAECQSATKKQRVHTRDQKLDVLIVEVDVDRSTIASVS